MDRSRIVEVLSDVMSLPTAPFHEDRVQAHVEREARRLGVVSRRDAYGNVILEYRRGKGREPIAFTAHMDHPGLEVVAGGDRQGLCVWHGAVPPHPLDGVGVAVHRGLDGAKVTGTIRGPVERSDIENARPFPIETDGPIAPGDFGHFDLVPFKMGSGKTADLAYTKGADDLGGGAAILLLFEQLVAAKPNAYVLGIFTRAEEVGFYGALAILHQELLPRRTWVCVLETSKALPGAEIGAGPVVRVGDRARIFDGDLLYVMKLVAEQRRAIERGFAYQMRVMDGGTCEATPYALWGYRAAGLAFPLGNYHNVGEKKVEPEYISVADVSNGLDLMWDLTVRLPEFEGMLKAQKDGIRAHLAKKLQRLQPAAVAAKPAPSPRRAARGKPARQTV